MAARLFHAIPWLRVADSSTGTVAGTSAPCPEVSRTLVPRVHPLYVPVAGVPLQAQHADRDHHPLLRLFGQLAVNRGSAGESLFRALTLVRARSGLAVLAAISALMDPRPSLERFGVVVRDAVCSRYILDTVLLIVLLFVALHGLHRHCWWEESRQEMLGPASASTLRRRSYSSVVI